MNIVITGASRGIGFDTAINLSLKDDVSVIALSRNLEGLKKLKNIAIENNLDIKIFACDLSGDERELNRIFSTINTVDVLINNAGILINKPFIETSLDEWRNIFESNLFNSVKLIKCLLPLLRKSKDAHIVNIGSMGGYQESIKFPGLSAYSGSKAALANLTECLAEEFKELNIRVNCLALGSVNTEMLKIAFPNYIGSMNSREIAKFISNFAVSYNKYFNGKIIPISISTP